MDKIVTLCPACSEVMKTGFSVKKVTNATTELGKKCENCGMRGSSYVLARYLISKKGR